MTQVLLISPPLARKGGASVAPPLGLLVVAAQLEDAGIHSSLIDMHLPGHDITDILSAIGSDTIVGLTSFTATINTVISIAAQIKESHPLTPVIIGGYHATTCFRELLDPGSPIDVVVTGPGTDQLPDLIKKLGNKGDLHDIDGIAYRRQSGVVVNKRHKKTKLRDRPFPARHLSDMKFYASTGSAFAGSLQFSRGCGGGCAFCQVPVMEGAWHCRDPRAVAEEVRELIDVYGLDRLVFVDNHLTGDPDAARELCEHLQPMSVLWSCDVRVDAVDEYLLKSLYDAGCRSLFVGFESGNPESLEHINKPSDPEFTRRQVALMRQLGFAVNGSFIIGFPWEDEAAIKRTIDFALELPVTWMEFSFATPLPGTRMERELPLFGAEICDYDFSNWDGQHPVMRLPHISRQRLVELYVEGICAAYSKGLNQSMTGR